MHLPGLCYRSAHALTLGSRAVSRGSQLVRTIPAVTPAALYWEDVLPPFLLRKEDPGLAARNLPCTCLLR
jgi:hypothetical protein